MVWLFLRHMYNNRRVVAVYYKLVNCTPLTPLLWIVVDLLYSLFLLLARFWLTYRVRGPPSSRQSTGRVHILCGPHENTQTRTFNGPFPGLSGFADARKVKLIWISLKQGALSGSGISWAICKSAPRSDRQPLQHPTTQFYFAGRMPFLLPNQQRQSTKGKVDRMKNAQKFAFRFLSRMLRKLYSI